jgi:hypothetical protein
LIRVSISYELCEFIGALIGDGNLWTDGSRYRIELTGDPILDERYLMYLSDLAFKVFGKKPYALKVREKGIRFRLQDKQAFELLTKLGMPVGEGKARHIYIPNTIEKKGWHYIKWVLRGIVDTDGTLFFSKKTYKEIVYPTIEIRTYSRRLGIQIDRLLKQKGFRSRLRGSRSRGFHVGLYGSNMLYKWINEIGFSNERHINKYLSRGDSLLSVLPQ